jgi:CAI-1 autoinducer synthase
VLDELGYNVDASASQIVALESGTEQQTIVLRDALEARNVFGAPFCAPATPKQRACIRLSLHSDLTDADIQWLGSVCAAIREEVGMARWASTRRKAKARLDLAPPLAA